MKTRYFIAAAIAAVGLVLILTGCTEQRPSEAPSISSSTATGDAPAAAVQTADAGAIEAYVTYAGMPVVETIRVNKDVEQCGTEAMNGKIVLGENGRLSHAVVSVAGLEGPPTARTTQIDQRGCQFRPRVVAMQAGEIEILNSDGILHNVHTYSEANPAINKAQPKFKKVMTETFIKPEVIKVTCDVHSWMLGWIAVLPHPYFGVTDERGLTRIEGVPPGTHTVEVWHEELGRRSHDVTVKAGETTRMTVAYPKRG
jgi:plastocyanin